MGPARVPNMSASIDEVFSNDEWVAAKLTWSGTHDGTFLGIEPTGRTLNVTEFEIVRIVDGWIVELRKLADMPSLIAQLSAPTVTLDDLRPRRPRVATATHCGPDRVSSDGSPPSMTVCVIRDTGIRSIASQRVRATGTFKRRVCRTAHRHATEWRHSAPDAREGREP
jgi:hypothetical protein